jgi:hypothetical protein
LLSPRRLSLFLLVLALSVAGPAMAKPPSGDWTLVHKDAYKHYACKLKGKGGFWRLKTATDRNGENPEYGVYVAVARGGNRRLPIERTSKNWNNGYIRLFLRGVLASDRLWMQGAYYGPTEPWSDGFPVRRIVRCASPA